MKARKEYKSLKKNNNSSRN